MKKVLWTALVTGATALGALASTRAAAWLWRRGTHEPPPDKPAWASLLIAVPVNKAVTRATRAEAGD
jgi:hypothetical protein